MLYMESAVYNVYMQVTELFKDHPDLLDEFTRFLPVNSAAASEQYAQHPQSTSQRYDDRSAQMPPSRPLLLDKVTFPLPA